MALLRVTVLRFMGLPANGCGYCLCAALQCVPGGLSRLQSWSPGSDLHSAPVSSGVLLPPPTCVLPPPACVRGGPRSPGLHASSGVRAGSPIQRAWVLPTSGVCAGSPIQHAWVLPTSGVRAGRFRIVPAISGTPARAAPSRRQCWPGSCPLPRALLFRHHLPGCGFCAQ